VPLWAILAIAYGVAALGAVVPSPWRPGFFAALAWLVILLPIAGLALLLSTWERATPAAWLALVPAAFVWLAYWDLKYGVSGRMSRRNDRASRASERPPTGNGPDA
jgi:hypothetical protein